MTFLLNWEREILNLLEDNPQGLYVYEIAEKLGVGVERAAIRLDKLMAQGLIRYVCEGRYFLTQSGDKPE